MGLGSAFGLPLSIRGLLSARWCPSHLHIGWWRNHSKAPAPFAQTDAKLKMSFGLKVPTALRDGKAQTYITTNFLFLDTRSQKQFWLSAMLFDLREEHTFPDTAHFDGWKGGTQMLILYSALNRKSEWMHPGADSALFASQPFADHQRFDIRVTADELQKAIHVIRAKFPATDAISDHAADCHLIHFNLNPRFLPPNAAMAAWDSHCGI